MSYCPEKATSSKVLKGQTMANIKLFQDVYVVNTHVQLQNDTGNFWGIIMFTRCYRLPSISPWASSKAYKCQRSTLDLSEIVMSITSLYSYNTMHAIPEDLSPSQDYLTDS